MIKKYIVTIISLLVVGTLLSQNLVKNPSFENNSGCPMGPSELEKADYWTNPFDVTVDTCSTSDYFNSCNPFGTLGVGVPDNLLGSEPARTGQAYAGIILYDAMPFGPCESPLLATGWREYLQGELTEPLIAGEEYCVSFWVSLAENVKWASSNFGVYFGSQKVMVDCVASGGNSVLGEMGYTPQLTYSGTPITNTNGWTKIQFTYVASGGEEFLIIGNFFKNSQTTVVCNNDNAINGHAYYYIDDVSVIQEICCDPTFEAPESVCLSDPSITLEPFTPGGTWSGDGVNTSGVFNPAAAGLGSHTITYTLSCGATEEMIIIVNPCDVLEVCVEEDGSLTVSGGTAPYQWHHVVMEQDCSACMIGCLFPPDCAVDVPAWAPFANGTTIPAPSSYPIMVTDNGGGLLEITDPSSLPSCDNSTPCGTITINFTVVNQTCSSLGQVTANPSGGTAPYTYSWNTTPAQTGQTATGLTAGSYVVTVEDSEGCTATESVTVDSEDLPIINNTQVTDPTCGNSDGSVVISVSGGQQPYTYEWKDEDGNVVGTSATVNGLGAGNYTVTVTDNNGCTLTESVTLNSEDAEDASFEFDNFCENSANGPSNIITPGGSFTFNPTPTDGATINASTGEISNAVGGTTYTVQYQTGGACSGTETVTVQVYETPDITIITTDPSCGNNDGVIDIVVNNGAPEPIDYSIGNGIPNQNNGNFTGLPSGNYSIVITDANGCVAIGHETLNDIGGATIDNITVTDSSCDGETGTISIEASGGNPPLTYSIDGGQTFQSSGDFNNLPAGTYSIIVRDDNGCVSGATVIIETPEPPVVSLVNSENVNCFGGDNGMIEVEATGGTPGYTYSWEPNVSSGTTAEDLEAGLYVITVTDANGCTGQLHISIKEPNQIEAEAQIIHSSCLGNDGEIHITATGGTGEYTYNWSPEVSVSDSAVGLAEGEYVITITDENGCTYTLTETIGVVGGFSVHASPNNITIQEGESVPITLIIDDDVDVEEIIWSPTDGLSCSDCANPIASPSTTTTYTVQVISSGGCVAQDTVYIFVKNPCGNIYVPTMFSPNTDTKNDFQCVMGGCIVTLDFAILNRWGETVFQTHDQNECWDGTYKGKLVQSGVYVYRLSATLENGETIKETGNITVVR